MGKMAPLPLSFYECFLKALVKRGDVEFITYNELMWGDDIDYKNFYPREWERWQAALRDGTRSRSKAYILLQHDTDSGPADTLRMAALEEQVGARSSIMTFLNWRSERVVGDLVSYPIDWDALKALESKGFCIGYHCNALHNADFDVERAYVVFREELTSLSHEFDLKFFSPHGGKSGPSGETNSSLDYPKVCPTPARWVGNRFAPRFNKHFSDGGLNGRLASGDERSDLRAWLHALQPGRHRVLIHAQYYREEEFEPFEGDEEMLPNWYHHFLKQTRRYGLREASQKFWEESSKVEISSDVTVKATNLSRLS